MSIAERLDAVRGQIAAACIRSGRPSGDVRLIAVSKTRPTQDIRTALQAGQLDFGENYAQELRDKGLELEDAAPRWHFIGHLQRNKVKYVVGRAALIHTIDSEKLAEAVAERARSLGLVQRVLIEVNSGEEAKSGVEPESALALARVVSQMEGLALQGMMTMPPYLEESEAAAPYFQTLAELAAEGRRQGLELPELSMGMSHDFAVAIGCGATLIRVGTAIFGARG